MYLGCDFNRRWLKDFNLLGCIAILLREGGRVMIIYKYDVSLSLYFCIFFRVESNEA
jgi:hypothetical protein